MNAITRLLYLPNVCATKADGADKGSKVLKPCLAVLKEMCASSAVLFPVPLVNLGTAIVQLNSVNTLFQLVFRYGEWKTQVPDGNTGLKKDSQWGRDAEKGWLEQSNGFYSKVFLTAGLAVESVRILQANYVLPVTENLFAVMGKVPVFQTASRVMNSFPAGSYVSSLVMKVSGLEIIKNFLFIGSSVFALKKACSDYQRAERSLELAIRNEADQRIPRLDIDKSNRAYWKEVTKLTVLGTASAIVLGFIASPVLLTMFNTVTVATAVFNLWCVVVDEQAKEERAEIIQPAPRDEDDDNAADENDGASSSSSSSSSSGPANVAGAVFSAGSGSDSDE